MAPSVLLVGAGGSLGKPLVEEFIRQKSRFSRIAVLATDESKKAKFANAAANGIEIVVGGLLEQSSYKGFDFVLSLVGNSLLKLQPAMIDIAYAAGVKHFYPSEFGVDLSQDELFLDRYFRSKQDTRLHLIATAKAHPDFKYTLLMTVLLTEWALLAFDASAKTFSYFSESEDIPWQVTSLPDVCRYTVESILLPSPGQKREYKIAGTKTTVRGLADAIGRARGIDVKVVRNEPEFAKQKQLEAFRNGDEDGEYYWALLLFLGSGPVRVKEDISQELFAIQQPETLDAALQRIFKSEE